MAHEIKAQRPRWQARLEIVGSEIFLRYRKRLMGPGIVVEIRRDYPSLGLIDVLVRVDAARRIIRDGEDFIALAAIRSGAWQDISAPETRPVAVSSDKDDRMTRLLIALGRGLFAVFCVIVLLSSVAQEEQVASPLVAVVSLLALLLIGTFGGRLGSDR